MKNGSLVFLGAGGGGVIEMSIGLDFDFCGVRWVGLILNKGLDFSLCIVLNFGNNVNVLDCLCLVLVFGIDITLGNDGILNIPEVDFIGFI